MAPLHRIAFRVPCKFRLLIPSSTYAPFAQGRRSEYTKPWRKYPLLRESAAANFSQRAQGNVEAEAILRLAVIPGLRERHRVYEAFVAVAEAERIADQLVLLNVVGSGGKHAPVLVEAQAGVAGNLLAVRIEAVAWLGRN